MTWTNLILELYCMRKDSCKKGKYVYEAPKEKDENGFPKLKRVPNTCYDPKYRTPKKPSYCKGWVGPYCFFKKCKHLGYCEADKDNYKLLDKKYHKKAKKK